MKIAYIVASIIPSRVANSIHVMKMCQALAKNGHDLVLLIPDSPGQYELSDSDVYDFYGVERCFEILRLPYWNIRRGRGIIHGILAARKAKSIKPDLVYCRNITGCLSAARLGLPVIYEPHEPNKYIIFDWMFRKLIKSPNLQKLVVISHALKEYYENNYPRTRGKIQVAPDGADPIPDNIQPAILPNKGKRLQVGYVGHLYKGRGIDLIIEIARLCSWADFHIVGGEKKYIQYWQEQTFHHKNIFLHGFVSPSQAERLRFAFDILLAPYQKKVATLRGGDTVKWMSPLKIFEYMSAGKPIISSDLPVLREVLEHKHNALLCPSENVDAWKDAMELLRDDPELRKNLGSEAQRIFLKNYTWATRASNVIDQSY
jgi:glycosyltransferase involved in cell wall biosynthesis